MKVLCAKSKERLEKHRRSARKTIKENQKKEEKQTWSVKGTRKFLANNLETDLFSIFFENNENYGT